MISWLSTACLQVERCDFCFDLNCNYSFYVYYYGYYYGYGYSYVDCP